MMKLSRRIKGMTIPEILMSILIGTLVIGIVMSMWYFAYRNWTVENIRTRLRASLEIAMERIKEEVRLSSTTYTSLYDPGGGVNYQAISFPAATPDANGFFAKAGDYIDWDKSVIYHTFDPGTGLELRRTEFANNNIILMDEPERYLQLVGVVTNGDGSGGPNAGNATTDVILTNLASFSITPRAQNFDGYSPVAKRSDNIEFGSIKLDPGNHDLKFEVVGKNPSSSGYEMGMDTLSITPSGCQREAEILLAAADSGGSHTTVGPDVMWSGSVHTEYTSGAVGDYLTYRLYYDQWTESNFNNAVLDNAILFTTLPAVKLPDFTEGNKSGWQAEVEGGSPAGDATKADYNDGLGNALPLTNMTIRTLISSGVTAGNLVTNHDAFRVKFDSHSSGALTITSAYIDERDMALMNQEAVDPALLGPSGSETRIQLYFTDGAENVTPGVTIPAGSSKYSNWAIFPIDVSKDYFVTFHITATAAQSYVSYWPGTVAVEPPDDINSYILKGDHASEASWAAYIPYVGHDNVILPLPTNLPPGRYMSSKNVYAVAELEAWSKIGSVTSTIYDTKMADPSYSFAAWNEACPAGSDIIVFARSSDNANMSAASWNAGSSINPHALTIGTGRYAQFKADLSLTPFWTCNNHAGNITDVQYKSIAAPVTTCPIGGKLLNPDISNTLIDDVTLMWPGATAMCTISGYFAQKPDYGIIELTVDGDNLTKGLEFSTAVSESLGSVIYDASLTAEVEPRNTGK
jgi:hypothetical protein